ICAMDAEVRKKAFRAKLAQKSEKRIDSPLVRYNEFDQPVCRVCNVTLKSESLWPAHQASRKHHEAIDNVKANAGNTSRVTSAKPEPPNVLNKSKPGHSSGKTSLEGRHSSSILPADFFDNQDQKRQRTGGTAQSQNVEHPDSKIRAESVRHGNQPAKEPTHGSRKPIDSEVKQVKGVLPENFFDEESNGLSKANMEDNEIHPFREPTQKSKKIDGPETKQVKGVLPEGFFDNKDADLRARGIEPVKLDAKDEYKEFEKLIQEDLQEVDDRLEEEEIDAAEMIEEEESLEQKICRERVELWKKKMELKAARSVSHSTGPQVNGKESSHEELSSDDNDDNENFAVDWRAQHL
ncbi:hypothetical protein RJ641_032419, partial [Dillenia turbinata]